MNLPLYIAKRYLFAGKSHNVINLISAISAAGMAVGTAALILILSVYNGFDSIIADNLSDLEPDLKIVPSAGKTFIAEGEAFDWLYDQDEVVTLSSTVEENVFVSYGDKQSTAQVKGVDEVWEEESQMASKIRSGEFSLHNGQIKECLVGAGLAWSMGISPRFVEPLKLWFPQRDANISVSNPYGALKSETVHPSGIFSVNADLDAGLIIVPVETLRRLLGYEKELSALEVRLASDASVKKMQKSIESHLGSDFKVLTRYQQNPALYKMMRYEKAAIFFILLFVVIIIAFNILGALQMLMIEKKEDIGTLASMGATRQLVRRIFVLEGWMISLIGLAVGLVAGLALALLQQHLGLVKMPGNFLVSAYPVIVSWSDVALVVIGVASVGYLVALIPALLNNEIKKI